MASLPSRTTASFDAIKPVSSLVLLDDELNDMKGAAGFLNGGTSGKKLLVKTSDATDPPVDHDQLGAGPLARWKLNGVEKAKVNNTGQIESVLATGTAPFVVASTTVVANLNAASVGGIAGANVAQVGVSKIPFSLAWRIDDPSTFTLNDDTGLVLLRVPAINTAFITKLTIIRAGGTHTAGGSVTFRARIFNGSNVGSGVSFNDTNNTINTPYTDDFVDTALADGNFLLVHISARSGTVSERLVSVNLEGYQTIKA